MLTNSIVLYAPDGSLAYSGHFLSSMPLMLDPSSMSELTSDFVCGLTAGVVLAAVLLGFRYVKKALAWVDGGSD